MTISASVSQAEGYAQTPPPFAMDGQAFRSLGHRAEDSQWAR